MIATKSLRSMRTAFHSMAASLPPATKSTAGHPFVAHAHASSYPARMQLFSSSANGKDPISAVKVSRSSSQKETVENSPSDGVKVAACGDIDDDDDDDEMEQEEMFVDAHESFEHKMLEWGGPRRGGRLPEPTRFGDWERKGRCTDF